MSNMNPPSALADPLRLPCGVVLPNRLAKAAMTEGLADAELRATPRLQTLYRRWSEGGAGLLITGNVMVDRRVPERPGNVVIDGTWPASVDAEARSRLRDWARAGTSAGNQLWMQLSHAGRQSPRYATRDPVGPSAVGLDLLGAYGRPRALDEVEIEDQIRRFATAATIARECGFTGVQIHAAHGYLISAFLSPLTNRRDDAWGGPLENRARLLLEVVRATRRAVGADFPIAVKLNSDDFRTGGFSADDSLAVIRMLGAEGIDLLELSGGTYEQPRLLGHAGKLDSVAPVRESTRRREAYFLAYAEAARPAAAMPLMLTGGFRTRAAMDEALSDGALDVIGLARPLVTEPELPRRLLSGASDGADPVERRLVVRARGWLSPTSRWLPARVVNMMGAQAWYYHQIFRLADGQKPDLRRGVLRSFAGHLADELRTAARSRHAR
jgi:2,4-dienoyl-CoA reductase-like NADH-dependent reductase (Old Yellow Enzyme family)